MNDRWRVLGLLRPALVALAQAAVVVCAEPVPMSRPGAPASDLFQVEASAPGGAWVPVPVFPVLVNQRAPAEAAFAALEFEGRIELRIRPREGRIESAEIRPLAAGVESRIEGDALRFSLERPARLSVEINGERLRNLHLFASAPPPPPPRQEDGRRQIVFGPGLHTAANHPAIRAEAHEGGELHWVDVPSDTVVLLHRDATVRAGLRLRGAENVHIVGRGVIDCTPWQVPDGRRRAGDGLLAIQAIRLENSRHVRIEGPILLSSPGYLVSAGGAEDLALRDIKGFNHHIWGDGFDFMACRRVAVEDVFLRTSDDCIAIYASRWSHRGDSRDFRVERATLWADKAHPIHLGTHGSQDPARRDTISGLVFRDIDILEHSELYPPYHGAMSVNAGDEVIVRDVLFESIRVETIDRGELFNVRVIHNPTYNPSPGHRIENVVFRDIDYRGAPPVTSSIFGYDAGRVVSGVEFHDVRYQGRPATNAADFRLRIGPHVERISVNGITQLANSEAYK